MNIQQLAGHDPCWGLTQQRADLAAERGSQQQQQQHGLNRLRRQNGGGDGWWMIMGSVLVLAEEQATAEYTNGWTPSIGTATAHAQGWHARWITLALHLHLQERTRSPAVAASAAGAMRARPRILCHGGVRNE